MRVIKAINEVSSAFVTKLHFDIPGSNWLYMPNTYPSDLSLRARVHSSVLFNPDIWCWTSGELELNVIKAVWLSSLISPMSVNKVENEIFDAFLTSKLYLEKNPTVECTWPILISVICYLGLEFKCRSSRNNNGCCWTFTELKISLQQSVWL